MIHGPGLELFSTFWIFQSILPLINHYSSLYLAHSQKQTSRCLPTRPSPVPEQSKDQAESNARLPTKPKPPAATSSIAVPPPPTAQPLPQGMSSSRGHPLAPWEPWEADSEVVAPTASRGRSTMDPWPFHPVPTPPSQTAASPTSSRAVKRKRETCKI